MYSLCRCSAGNVQCDLDHHRVQHRWTLPLHAHHSENPLESLSGSYTCASPTFPPLCYLHTCIFLGNLQDSSLHILFVSFTYRLVQRTVQHTGSALGRTGYTNHAVGTICTFCRWLILNHLIPDPVPALIKPMLQNRPMNRMKRNAGHHFSFPVDMESTKPG